MNADPPVPLVSVEEYHRMPELNERGRRTELIRGVVVEKKAKSPIHCYTVHRMERLLRAAEGPGQLVCLYRPLTLTDSEPEPDVAMIAGAENDYFKAHPTTALLAVEVSVTTLETDCEKAEIYAEADIPEYWIMRPKRGVVEVYTQPQGGFYRERRIFTAAEGATLASTAVPALRLELATFFAG